MTRWWHLWLCALSQRPYGRVPVPRMGSAWAAHGQRVGNESAARGWAARGQRMGARIVDHARWGRPSTATPPACVYPASCGLPLVLSLILLTLTLASRATGSLLPSDGTRLGGRAFGPSSRSRSGRRWSLFSRYDGPLTIAPMGYSELTEQREDSAVAATPAPTAQAYLLVVHPWAQRASYKVSAPGVTLGRASTPPQADRTFDEPRMSRLHARLTHGASSWQLVELGSRNGTYVDGRALRASQEVALTDGAVLRLGDLVAVFREAPPGTFDVPTSDEQVSFPGVSPGALAVRRRLRELAAASGHVLVVGETGTGKERASRAIGAPGQEVLALNCAELTRHVARAVLFGYAQGAFTGATSAKAGLVDAAGGGVLFLDEVGELPLDVQGDLLRFLEDGSYRPIGSKEIRKSKARVVAATNVDLDDAAREGRFRRDLLARLRAHNPTVKLPPLRERREDILGWANHFAARAFDVSGELWSSGAAECLLLYPWPENLRELRGTIRALAFEAAHGPRPSTDLPAPLHAHRRGLRGVAPSPPMVAVPRRGEEPTRAEIEAMLRQTKGVMRAAAEKLQVDRRQLYRLCTRLGIDIECYRVEPEPEVT